jgi:hypothetical protein
MTTNNNGYWPYAVSPGDILRSSNGEPRKVLRSIQGASGYTTSVVLLKKRKSWTTRPVTVLNYTDLARLGYRPFYGLRVPLTHMELAIAEENCCTPARDPSSLRYHDIDL